MGNASTGEEIKNSSSIVWYQAILNRYNSVSAANNSIDTKTGVIIATAVAILVYASQITTAPRILAILGIIGLVAAIVLCLKNVHVRPTSTEVHTTKEKPGYYDQNDKDFIWQLIPDLENSLKKLNDINKTKGELYVWGVYTFVIASALVMLSQYIKFTVVPVFGWA